MIPQLVKQCPAVGSKFLCPTEDDVTAVEAALRAAGKSAVVVLSERVDCVCFRVAQGALDGYSVVREDGESGGADNPAPLGTTVSATGQSASPVERPRPNVVKVPSGKVSAAKAK